MIYNIQCLYIIENAKDFTTYTNLTSTSSRYKAWLLDLVCGSSAVRLSALWLIIDYKPPSARDLRSRLVTVPHSRSSSSSLMAAAPAGRYAYSIPSLSESVPNLPPLGNLDINRAVVANTPVNAANLRNAKNVAENLKATHCKPFLCRVLKYIYA